MRTWVGGTNQNVRPVDVSTQEIKIGEAANCRSFQKLFPSITFVEKMFLKNLLFLSIMNIIISHFFINITI